MQLSDFIDQLIKIHKQNGDATVCVYDEKGHVEEAGSVMLVGDVERKETPLLILISERHQGT